MKYSKMFLVISTVMAIGICEPLDEGAKLRTMEDDEQPQIEEAKKNQHNSSITQNFPDPELHVLLQLAIAACCSVISEIYAVRTNSFMVSSNIEELRLQRHVRDFVNRVLICVNTIKVEIENSHGQRDPSFNRKYNLIVVDSSHALR